MVARVRLENVGELSSRKNVGAGAGAGASLPPPSAASCCGGAAVTYTSTSSLPVPTTTGTVSTLRVRGRTRPCYLMIEGDADNVTITRHYPGVGSDLLLQFNPRTLEYNKSDEIIAGHRTTRKPDNGG